MIAKRTLKKHGMGLGIFTMQGFEHRNKESKICFIKLTNKKGNVCIQVLNRLWDIFGSQIRWKKRNATKKEALKTALRESKII